MSLHFFAVPALSPEPAQAELNAFLAQARVVAVQRQLVADGAASYWAVCAEVVAGPSPLPPNVRANAAKSAANVDYKQVLNAKDFTHFAALREWRKQVAQQEGVPVYAVFTNDQLAAVVQQAIRTKSALAQIEGVGPARVERYGAALLAELQALANAAPLPTDTQGHSDAGLVGTEPTRR